MTLTWYLKPTCLLKMAKGLFKRSLVLSAPDILMIVLDTQRADRLSCYGYAQETTPYLDKLAADSALFKHAFSAAQWTVPAHASMFTGQYPSIHGTQHSDSMLPATLPTLAERLSMEGYYTAAYCNNPLVGVVNNGLRRGFQSFLNYSGLLTSRPNQAGVRRTITDRYRQVFKRVLGNTVHKMQDSFARSDALLWFAFSPLMVPFWQTALSFKGNTGKSLNDTAQLLIQRKQAEQDQPIFAFVNLMGTHMPFHPSRKMIDRFAPNVLQSREELQYLRRFNSDVFGWLTPLASEMAHEHKAILDGMYDAEVSTQDEHLGNFFNQLESSGALDNTLVMVVADHGEHLGEKHLIGHTVSLYRELTHVPLIIRDPSGNISRGTIQEHPVSTRRLFHTALTAAGVATEDEEQYTLAQTPGNDADKGIVYAEAQTPNNVLNLMMKHKPDLYKKHRCDQERLAVWQDQHKLIITGGQHRELFNYVEDPAELNNISPEKPKQTVELAEKLLTQMHQFKSNTQRTESITEEEDDPQMNSRLRALGYLD